MKKFISITLALIMLLALFGCASKSPAENSGSEISQTESAQSSEAEHTVVCCMGTVEHPVHRVMQYGFCVEAEKLGMKPVVSGLQDGSMEDLIDEWQKDIVGNSAAGVMIYTGDDSCYKLLKELKNSGVYTVLSYFRHDYQTTKGFVDSNNAFREESYGEAAAEFLVNKLAQNGITEGEIAVTLTGPAVYMGVAASNAFKEKAAQLQPNLVVLDAVFEATDSSGAVNTICSLVNEHPEIVAAFGIANSSAKNWARAKSNLGREDIVVVACGQYEDDIIATENGEIAGLLYSPMYQSGLASAVTLKKLIDGQNLSENENTWFTEMEIPIATLDGEGENNIQTYRDIFDAAQAYFEE